MKYIFHNLTKCDFCSKSKTLVIANNDYEVIFKNIKPTEMKRKDAKLFFIEKYTEFVKFSYTFQINSLKENKIIVKEYIENSNTLTYLAAYSREADSRLDLSIGTEKSEKHFVFSNFYKNTSVTTNVRDAIEFVFHKDVSEEESSMKIGTANSITNETNFVRLVLNQDDYVLILLKGLYMLYKSLIYENNEKIKNIVKNSNKKFRIISMGDKNALSVKINSREVPLLIKEFDTVSGIYALDDKNLREFNKESIHSIDTNVIKTTWQIIPIESLVEINVENHIGEKTTIENTYFLESIAVHFKNNYAKNIPFVKNDFLNLGDSFLIAKYGECFRQRYIYPYIEESDIESLDTITPIINAIRKKLSEE